MSAILIGGGHNNSVVFRDPTSPNAYPHRWWAERGMLHWECQITGAYGSQSVAVTLERMKGLNDMIGNSRTDKGFSRPDEVAAYQRYIDGMLELCKLAHSQGRPDDPKHAAQMRAKIKADRQSRLVVMPGFNSRF